MSDKRIVYLNNIPFFKGEYKLSKKQLRRVLAGRWKGKDDAYIIQELNKSIQNKHKRIGYHELNKSLLDDKVNYQLILKIRLAVIEDLISKFRREKALLRKEIKAHKPNKEVIE